MQNSVSDAKERNYVLEIIKALIVALIITFLLVLLSALIIKIFAVSSSYICVFNQVIKGVSIFLGALVSLRRSGGGFIRGIIFGIAYILIAFVIFSCMNGYFEFNISLLNDVAFGSVAGLISGIVAVNLRK